MAISLDQWKTRVFKEGQTLPANSFILNVTPPVGGGEELQIRTDSVVLPGTAFMSVDNFSPFGNGKIYNIPYKYNPQEVNMTHIIDNKADLYKTFRDWSNRIVDLDGDQKFAAKYMEPSGGGYVVDFDVEIYNRQQKKVKTVKFIEAYPIVVEPIQMNWGTFDDIAKLAVSYRFTRFEVN